MNNTWRNINGVDITYNDLFLEAMNLWNSLNIKGDGTNIFGVDNSLFNSRVIKAIPYQGSTACCYSYLGNIDLNTNEFINTAIDRQRAVDIISHEMGHALGLGDLYICSSDNYIYEGQIIDNTDKLMYGFWNLQNLALNGLQRVHSNEIFGVRKIQNWPSYMYFNKEDLIHKSDIIVHGIIEQVSNCNIIDYDTTKYTKIKISVKEYLYSNSNFASEIEFLQEGTIETYFDVNKIFEVDEECILFLYYGPDGKIYLSGGPQGRFDVIFNNGDSYIENHMEKYISNSIETSECNNHNEIVDIKSFKSRTMININSFKHKRGDSNEK